MDPFLQAQLLPKSKDIFKNLSLSLSKNGELDLGQEVADPSGGPKEIGVVFGRANVPHDSDQPRTRIDAG